MGTEVVLDALNSFLNDPERRSKLVARFSRGIEQSMLQGY
jgi:hypothetical protein